MPPASHTRPLHGSGCAWCLQRMRWVCRSAPTSGHVVGAVVGAHSRTRGAGPRAHARLPLRGALRTAWAGRLGVGRPVTSPVLAAEPRAPHPPRPRAPRAPRVPRSPVPAGWPLASLPALSGGSCHLGACLGLRRMESVPWAPQVLPPRPPPHAGITGRGWNGGPRGPPGPVSGRSRVAWSAVPRGRELLPRTRGEDHGWQVPPPGAPGHAGPPCLPPWHVTVGVCAHRTNCDSRSPRRAQSRLL